MNPVPHAVWWITASSIPFAGLGLAILKGTVEAHDGTVTVHNEPHGCRLLVHLPAQPEPLMRSEAR